MKTENDTSTMELNLGTGSTVQIISTPPVGGIKDGTTLVSWSRRSTEKNPVPTAERYRGVVIPAANLALPDGATTSKFSRLLQSTIYDLAAGKFQAYITDRMFEATMPTAVLTLDSVIAFWAEEKQRQTIDAAKITDFLKSSETIKTLPENTAKVWISKVPRIAAPSYKNLFSKEQAAVIISKLADADNHSPIYDFIVTRCNNIISEVSEEEAL
jgi:hypothetical protein